MTRETLLQVQVQVQVQVTVYEYEWSTYRKSEEHLAASMDEKMKQDKASKGTAAGCCMTHSLMRIARINQTKLN